MEIGLPRGDDDALLNATVKQRAIDVNGNPFEESHCDPLLDTHAYEVEFVDGSTEIITANVIAKNLFAQVDGEGHQQMLLHDIIDHKHNSTAIQEKYAFIITKYGTKQRRKTTRGWQLCIEWKDGSTDWVQLKDIKHAYPVEIAEYAIRNVIHDTPAFAWWVPHVIKKREMIIFKLKSKYWDGSHK